MKAASAGFKTMIATSKSLVGCDLYTITPLNGAVYRFATQQIGVTVGGNPYLAAGYQQNPGFKRQRVSMKLGVQAQTMLVTMIGNANTLIGGAKVPALVRAGPFDNAWLSVDRLLMPSWGSTTNGTVNVFQGIISEAKATRNGAILTVSGGTRFLQGRFPRNAYLPTCNHTLYDTGCTLNKATFAVSGTVASGTDTSDFTAGSMSGNPTGYFALGWLQWTSGANNGVISPIKAYTLSGSVGSFVLMYPVNSIPSPGDTFTAYPGCDKLETTCATKFSNQANFRGFQFVPNPATLLAGQQQPPSDDASGGAGQGGIGTGGGGANTNFKLQ